MGMALLYISDLFWTNYLIVAFERDTSTTCP